MAHQKEKLIFLGKKKTKEFLKENNCKLNNKFKVEVPEDLNLIFRNFYECDNDVIISVDSEDKGKVYRSLEIWQQFRDEIIKVSQTEPIHLSQLIISDSNRFIENIDSSIQKLSKILDIDIKLLNFTKESLLLIDKKINKKRYVSENKHLFLGIVSYFGEVLKLYVNGQWEVKHSNNKNWEANIVDKRGTKHSFFIQVYDEIFESHICGLYNLFNMLLMSNNLNT